MKLTLLPAVLVAVGSSMTSCNQTSASETPLATTEVDYVLRGKYLVEVGGCNDCHTPKVFTGQGMELDMSKLMAGHPAGDSLPPLDEKVLQPGNWIYFNGHSTAAAGPWGMTFAKNLTPHETGIKGWEEEVFIKALRTGKHMGVEMGRPILPPMPWTNLAKATDDDLRAIYKYLMSLDPVDNRVPEPISPDGVREMIRDQNKAS